MAILGFCTQLVQECNSNVLPWRVSNNISNSNNLRWIMSDTSNMKLKHFALQMDHLLHISFDETAINWRKPVCIEESAFIFSNLHTSQVCYLPVHCKYRKWKSFSLFWYSYSDAYIRTGEGKTAISNSQNFHYCSYEGTRCFCADIIFGIYRLQVDKCWAKCLICPQMQPSTFSRN